MTPKQKEELLENKKDLEELKMWEDIINRELVAFGEEDYITHDYDKIDEKD